MRYSRVRLRKPRKLRALPRDKVRELELELAHLKRAVSAMDDMTAMDSLSPRLRSFFRTSPGNAQAAAILIRNDPKEFTDDRIIQIFTIADEQALETMRKWTREWLQRRDEGAKGAAVPLPPSFPRRLNSTEDGW